MAVYSMTLDLPGTLYERLMRRAERTRRPVEIEMLEAVTAAVSLDEQLPADLAEAVQGLTVLDDSALWRAARSHLPFDKVSHLEALHIKRQAGGLSGTETETLRVLVKEYERVMLVRAQAALILKQRGYDVADLITST